MKGLRICLAVLAIGLCGTMAKNAEAGDWAVRVQVESAFNGHTYYPTLYSSPEKSDASTAFAWYEMVMKLYPQKFRSDVLNPLGVPSYYFPVRLHLVYMRGISPTGRL